MAHRARRKRGWWLVGSGGSWYVCARTWATGRVCMAHDLRIRRDDGYFVMRRCVAQNNGGKFGTDGFFAGGWWIVRGSGGGIGGNPYVLGRMWERYGGGL